MGEGDCEYAFLQHLRSLYCAERLSVKVTIRNAQGGCPKSIVNQVIRHIRLAHYDRQIALLDTDLVWSESLKKTAKKNKIEMIGSKPCLEGLLLRVLGKTVPNLSTECKKQLQSFTKSDLTERFHYEPYFSKVVFEKAREVMTELDQLLGYLEGKFR